MLLAAVAPVAPVGGAAVALTLFLAYVTCLGLLWVYRATLSAIVLGVAHAISRLRTPGFPRTQAAVRAGRGCPDRRRQPG
jgi:hypothetical protein